MTAVLPKFNASKSVSIGMELELQLINCKNYDLESSATTFLQYIGSLQKQQHFLWNLKPEITQSMIEINTSVHEDCSALLTEVITIQNLVSDAAQKLNVAVCGGGTHPFQRWKDRKIFPARRFKHLSQQYGYLAKQFTVFGQHIHIGCPSGDDAIYLTHALSRYIPHLIALSASSPFQQGVDTGYDSSRTNIINMFPLSGVMPFMTTWEEFENYFNKMLRLNVIASMKDFYWDIRPQAELGTVEIRICDTPLTIEKAVAITAFAQSLADHLLQQRELITADMYLVYNFNRYQANRYGLHANFINPYTYETYPLHVDFFRTLQMLKKSIAAYNNQGFIAELKDQIKKRENCATWLRQQFLRVNSFEKLVQLQCNKWMKNFTPENAASALIATN